MTLIMANGKFTPCSFTNREMVPENHYPLESELTDYHRSKIAELRQKAAEDLKRYPGYDTDFSLLRWLMGWDYNIDVILPKMKNVINVLVNQGISENDVKTCEDVNRHIRSYAKVVEYFPGGLMGPDREGNIVYMQAMGQAIPKSLIKGGSNSGLYIWSIAETELAFKLVRDNEKERGKKLGVKIIMDLEGFSMDHMYTPTLKMYLGLLSTMQDLFPDMAKKIFIINCPMMIQTVYAMISPALSKQTREKVNFLGPDWKDVLADDLGSDYIYPHWGGTKKSEKPTGDLRMGGKVPEDVLYHPEDNPNDGDKSTFTKLPIGARSREKVMMRAKASQTIRWIWRVSSGDVDFSVEFADREVFSKMRLSTEFHPEIGELKCAESGDYSFYFDNSHGKVFGKDIRYKIWVE